MTGKKPTEKLIPPAPQTLDQALMKAQAAMAGLAEDSYNDYAGFGYVSAEAMIEASRSVLLDNGLVLIRLGYQYDYFNEDGVGRLDSDFSLTHVETGQTRVYRAPFPYVVGKGKPPDKALATALTTSLSYFLRDLLLIPRKGAGDDMSARDDEDVKPPAQSAITPDQWAELNDLIAETMTDEKQLLRHYGIQKLAELPQARYEEVHKILTDRRNKQ